MSFSWSPHDPLNGAAVFLSASVPHPQRDRRFLAGPLEELLMLRLVEQRIFDAVQSLVAQLLGAGGRLVHGGHPTITNTIAALVSNWSLADDDAVAAADPPILLYQSSHFANLPAPPGREEMELAGLAVVRWTPPTLAATRVNGEPLLERFHLRPEWIEAWLPLQASANTTPALREALLAMRLAMLLESQPCAAVCIGGMEGIEAEAQLYRDLCARSLLPGPGEVNVLASTFGAAAQLTGQHVRVVEDLTPEDVPPWAIEFRKRELGQLRVLDSLRPEQADRPLGPDLAQTLWLERMSYDGVLRDFLRGIQASIVTTDGPAPPGRR